MEQRLNPLASMHENLAFLFYDVSGKLYMIHCMGRGKDSQRASGPSERKTYFGHYGIIVFGKRLSNTSEIPTKVNIVC